MSNSLILCTSANTAEIAPILALLKETETIRLAGRVCYQGTLRDNKLALIAAGSGGTAVGSMLSSFLNQLKPRKVLHLGIAGALNPTLRPGDVLLANRARSWFEGNTSTGTPRLLGADSDSMHLVDMKTMPEPLPFHLLAGTVVSWDVPVMEFSLKNRLRSKTSADCVDMETGITAQICSQCDIPFVSIRGISDRCGGPVEDFSIDEFGVAIWHATLVALSMFSGDK